MSENKCPVDHETREKWMHMSEEQKQQAMTDGKLSQERAISSIPRTNASSNWVYPSEQQFYESMQRKNMPGDKMAMKSVIPIHNNVNERVWNFIKSWEGPHAEDIKLTSFKGDSKKLTPRAWMRCKVFGMDKPFDRHDWVVDRLGSRIDYVIDFYYRESQGKNNGGVYMDVRPKLNTFQGCKLRFLKFVGLA